MTPTKLIPASITLIKDDSVLNDRNTKKTVDLTLQIEFIGSGDFSKFVTADKLDFSKISEAILTGELSISGQPA